MTNFLHKSILIPLLALLTLAAGAQQLPKVIPPSPETSALFRYLDYPVGNSTGIPKINIPLYEVRSGSLSMPISISYHASGRRVNDETGPVGLGWTLNCGGMISRTVYGKVDEYASFPPYLKKASEITYQDYTYLASLFYNKLEFEVKGDGVLLGDYDPEYDVFSYSFGTNSGKFIMDNAGARPILIPSKPLQITGYYFPRQITDEKGVKYGFGKSESIMMGSQSVETGAYLTSITSPDGKDNITFGYRTFEVTTNFPTEQYNFSDDFLPYEPPRDEPRGIVQSLPGFSEYHVQRITEIAFEGGRVVFTQDGNSERIQSIQVQNDRGEVIRTIEFKRSILDSSGSVYQYKLDNLLIKDSKGAVIEKYAFEYNPSEGFDPKGRDFWGYRNGGNNKLLPNYTVWDSQGNSKVIGNNGDRRADANYMQRGVLRKITYPTGGSTEFTYEGNMIYAGPNTILPSGGLRVKQIMSRDGNGGTATKTYGYPKYGYRQYLPSMFHMAAEKRFIPGLPLYPNYSRDTPLDATHRTRSYYSEPFPEISYLIGQPIFYDYVEEYLGTETSNAGKVVYVFEGGSPGYMAQFYAPNFSYVSSPRGENVPHPPFLVDDLILPYYVYEFNFWDTPVPEATRYYENIGKDSNGRIQYKIRKSTKNTYKKTETRRVRGMHLHKYMEFPGDNGTGDKDGEYEGGAYFNYPVFLYADYYVSIGKKELISTTETDYSDNGQVTVSTSYTYNARHLVSETRRQTSGGQELVTKQKYPFDFDTEPVYQAMVSRNMVDYVVEQSQYKNQETTPLESMKTTYKDWGGNLIAPEVISTRQGAEAYEPRLRYHGYGAGGRIRSVSKQEGVPVTYVWGYGSQYPVAEIKNATHVEVEAALGGAAAVEELAGSNMLSQAQLDKLNGLRDLLLNAMVTTYTYVPLVGMTSVTYANGLTDYYDYDSFGRLTQVRDQDRSIMRQHAYNIQNPSYFSAAKSGTFTKNDCGPNFAGSQETYTVPAGAYASSVSQEEADDKAQHDVDTKGQAYANREGICFVYSNREQQGTFTKNDCGGGYLGSEVTYTVVYGTYTSTVSYADADAKAEADIQANGQAYANANGTCRPDVVYQNAALSRIFIKTCPFGYTGSQVTYTVAAGAYTSTYSQEDADAKAEDDIANYGQTYANDKGYCTENPKVTVQVFNNSHYDALITYSNSTGSVSYTVPKGGTTAISVPSGTYTLQISLPGNTLYTYTFELLNGSVMTGQSATFQSVQSEDVRIY